MNDTDVNVIPFPSAKPAFDARRSIRRLMLAGTACSLFLVFGIGGWAATTEISGAVIAEGRLIVESSVKKVQHPTGGVVGELLVREGQHVHAGDVVLRLDQTQTLASLQIIRQGLDELTARQARDRAEQDGATAIAFPPGLEARRADPLVSRLLVEAHLLLRSRTASRAGQKAQSAEQLAPLEGQIAGGHAEIEAKATESRLNERELAGVQTLWDQHLIQYTRLATLQAEAAKLKGENGRLIASLAEIMGRIAETRLKILQIDQDMRTDVGKELAELRGRISELEEKQIAAKDQLKRTDMRATQDGFVHELAVHTVGGVVTAGESIMLIVPDGDALTVEARIQPGDINQVHLGQSVFLRFPGLSQRTTPEIDGTVSLVSADLTSDEKLGTRFFTIRITLSDEQTARLGRVKLVPGMPVESFIQTQPRTVMSFLVKPMRDQIERAFRER